MRARRSPIIQPRVGDLLSETHSADFLHATADSEHAVLNRSFPFLCVDEPAPPE